MPDSLPPIDLKSFTDEHREEMFGVAYNAWASAFDPGQLISELRSPEPTARQRSELKHVRKYGLVLRSAYQMLDERHIAPRKHWKFMKLLGDVNDAYFTPHRAETADRAAHFVESEYESLDGMEFIPSSQDSFVEYYQNNLERIKEFNNSETLPAEDYHMLRKLLRNYMNLFRLSGMITHNPQTLVLGKYMQRLNDQLGIEQDNLTQQHLEGAINYHTSSVTVPEEMREKIQMFINAHQIDPI